MSKLPLAGIRIVEFGFVIAGPLATRLLADFGAEVIKIESRVYLQGFRGSGGLAIQTPAEGVALRHFNEFNRNKRAITLNMSKPEGRELLRQLLSRSDVLLDNYGPGVAERWGLGYDQLKDRYPRLIVVNMPGMGTFGPLKDYVTWGNNISSFTGMTYLWGLPTYKEPVGSQAAHPDYIGARMAAAAIMFALLYRQRTGRGQHIEIAQVEGAASMLGPFFLDNIVNGRDPQPQGNRHPYLAPYNCYRCKGEDRWCYIAVTNEKEWELFCDALGNPAWTKEPRFADLAERLRNVAALDEHVESWTLQRTPHEVMETLQPAGVPAGVVQNGKDLFEDRHLRERGFLVDVYHEAANRSLTYPGLAAHLSETPGGVFSEAPNLGRDNDYVFKELLHLSDAEIARLAEAQVLY